jgi:dTDP-4-dehydrorhamnose reductase
MNRVELALTILKYFPHTTYDLIPMSTAEMNQPAKRPLRGGLLKTKFSALYPSFLFSNVDDFVKQHVII